MINFVIHSITAVKKHNKKRCNGQLRGLWPVCQALDYPPHLTDEETEAPKDKVQNLLKAHSQW